MIIRRSNAINVTIMSNKSSTIYDSIMTSSNGNIFRAAGHFPVEFVVTGEFPSQRPVTRSFNIFFDLCQN